MMRPFLSITNGVIPCEAVWNGFTDEINRNRSTQNKYSYTSLLPVNLSYMVDESKDENFNVGHYNI